MKNIKTNKNFWNWYLNESQVKNDINRDLYFDNNIVNFFEQNINFDKIDNVFEIGCCPGRFLKFFHSKKIEINGIDYSKESFNEMIEDFKKNNISYNNIILEDFSKFKSKKKYDLVCSFGFIEHFDDVAPVINSHVDLLNDKGTLLIGIPNFTGITGFFQKHVEKKILDAHNLKIMNLQFFYDIASNYSLSIENISFLGGYDNDMISRTKKKSFKNIFLRIILKILQISKLHILMRKFKNKYFSSYIIALYSKNK